MRDVINFMFRLLCIYMTWHPIVGQVKRGKNATFQVGHFVESHILVHKIWAPSDHPNPFINSEQVSPLKKLAPRSNGVVQSDGCKKKKEDR